MKNDYFPKRILYKSDLRIATPEQHLGPFKIKKC